MKLLHKGMQFCNTYHVPAGVRAATHVNLSLAIQCASTNLFTPGQKGPNPKPHNIELLKVIAANQKTGQNISNKMKKNPEICATICSSMLLLKLNC